MSNVNCSLMNEIQSVEESIKTCYERVYLLKSKLKSGSLTKSHKENLEQDLLEVEKLLATNKTILKKLHKNNRSTFLFASAICLLFFMAWMMYELLFNKL